MVINPMREQITRTALLEPILSIISPKLVAPMTSPKPKAIIAKSALESASFSSTSGPYCITIIGTNIPDQNAIDTPLQNIYGFNSIIFFETINLSVDVSTSQNVSGSFSKLSATDFFYSNSGDLMNPKQQTANNMIPAITTKKEGPEMSVINMPPMKLPTIWEPMYQAQK